MVLGPVMRLTCEQGVRKPFWRRGKISSAMTGGVIKTDGAGEKFHFVGMFGNALLDMELTALSMIQLRRLGNQADMKSWKKNKLRVWDWSNVAWSAVYRGN